MSTFDDRKRASTSQCLMAVARLLNERAIARLRRRLDLPFRTSHTTLLPHIPLAGGVRQTELAQRLGVSKQAVGQLVDELEGLGVLTRWADPGDGRARQVGYTPRGRTLMAEGLAELETLDAELAEHLGPASGALHGALLAALSWLEEAPPAG